MAGRAPLLTIDDFSAGIIRDASIPAKNAFQTLRELSIVDSPGLLQMEGLPTAETEAAAADDIQTLIRWFESYDGNGGTLRLMGLGSAGRMFVRSAAGTWTRRNTDANAGQGQGMCRFGTRVFWGSDTNIGQVNGNPEAGGSYTNSYLTVTLGAAFASGTTQVYRPMKEFLGNLFVGDGRYLFKLESDYTTFDNDAFILPINHTVSSLEVWNDRLAIGTYYGTGNINDAFGARVFLWDGVSPRADVIEDADTEGVAALINLNEQLYMAGGRSGSFYLFNGTEWALVRAIPGANAANLIRPSMVARKDDNIFIGYDSRGIFRWGRPDTTIPYSLTTAYRPSANQTNFNIGAITNFQNQIYFSWQDTDAATFGVDAVSTTSYRTGGVLESQIYEIEDKGNTRLIQAIEVIPRTFTTNHTITVDYKLDNAAAYTNLGTLSSTNINQPLYGIFSRGKTIQFRLTLLTALATSTPTISKILVY